MAEETFQYEVIADGALRLRVESQTQAIKSHLHRSSEAVVDIGRRMQEVYDALPTPIFRAWVKCEFGWTRSTASSYMQAARVFGNCDCLAQIQPGAITILARQKVPEIVIQAVLTRARSGQAVAKKNVQSLLTEHDVPTAPRSARKPREVHAEAVAVAAQAANPATALRETLDTFVVNIDRLAESLSDSDRNALSDRFLQLAIKIRQVAPLRPFQKSRRKLAAAS